MSPALEHSLAMFTTDRLCLLSVSLVQFLSYIKVGHNGLWSTIVYSLVAKWVSDVSMLLLTCSQLQESRAPLLQTSW